MKKGYTIILLCIISASLNAQTFHWIGPSGGAGGSWNNGNNWSLTSGGVAAGDFPQDAADDAVFDQNALVNLDGMANFPLNSIKVILNKTAKLFTTANLDITVNSSSAGNEGLRIDAGSTLRDSADGATNNFRIVFGAGSSGEMNGDFYLAGNASLPSNNGASVQATSGILTVGNGGRIILRPRSALLQGSTTTMIFEAGSFLIFERDGGTAPTATYNAASTIRITGNINNATKLTSSAAASVGNVEYDCAGLVMAAAFGLTNANVQGYLKIFNTNGQVLAIMTNPGPGTGVVTTTISGNLEVSGNSGVAIATAGQRPVNLQVNGNYVQSGGVFSLQTDGSATFQSKMLLKGNFIQTGGTYTANSTAQSTVTNLFVLEMNGTSAQTFSTNIGTIDNAAHQVALRMNNASNLTLNSPLAVGRLDFAAGKIFTTTNNALTITNMANNPIDVNGASASSYVDGPLKRMTALATAYAFPVGKGGNYGPVEVIPSTTAASQYSAEYFNTGHSDLSVSLPLTGVANNRYWDLIRVSGSSAAIRLTLNGAVPGAGPTDGIVVAHYNGADWTNEKGSTGTVIFPGTATSGTVTSQVETSFSPFTFGFGPSSSLPIKLEYFTAEKGSGFNTLHWKANCTSVKVVFEIERSTDGRQFSKIGKIEADQLRCLQPFDYNDLDGGQGTVYYRVRVVDVDGSAFYSRIVAIVGRGSGFDIVGIYPSLVTTGQLKVNVASGNNSKAEFFITNAMGQVVKKFRFSVVSGDNIFTLSLPELAGGVYQLTGYNSEGLVRTFRFVKQ